MPRLHPRALVAALLTAALLTGCATAPPELHAPVGYASLSSSLTTSGCDEPSFAAGQGDLIGPHFAFTATCVHFGRTVDEDFHPDGERPLAPPPGYEYAVVQFASDSPVAPAYDADDAGDLTAALVFGEEATTLETVPEDDDVLVAIVPRDGPLLLTVTDEGRAQSLDLRGFARVQPVDAYYHGLEGEIGTPGYSMRAEGAGDGWTGWYSLSGDIRAERTVWSPESGWAEDGRATLTLTVEWARKDKKIDTYFELFAKSSMKVDSGDQHYSPVSVDSSNVDSVWMDYVYVFDVPADAVEFKVKFQPQGKLTIIDGNHNLKLSKSPKANSFTLSFSLS